MWSNRKVSCFADCVLMNAGSKRVNALSAKTKGWQKEKQCDSLVACVAEASVLVFKAAVADAARCDRGAACLPLLCVRPVVHCASEALRENCLLWAACSLRLWWCALVRAARLLQLGCVRQGY